MLGAKTNGKLPSRKPVETSRSVDTSNFIASTVQGTIKELYGYVPSSDLLASVRRVAATEKNSRAEQLATFVEKSAEASRAGAEI